MEAGIAGIGFDLLNDGPSAHWVEFKERSRQFQCVAKPIFGIGRVLDQGCYQMEGFPVLHCCQGPGGLAADLLAFVPEHWPDVQNRPWISRRFQRA